MINLDSITNENNNAMKNAYIFQIIVQNFDNWWFWIRKANTLLNLINEHHDIDKIYLYAKDLNEPKYEILTKKRKDAGIKRLNDPNAFIECSNMIDDVYENIHEYNSSRKRKILIVFDDMIIDIMANKKFQAIIKELFIRCRKLNISTAFITQSYLSVPKDVRLNSTHSADIDYGDFIKIYREYTNEPWNLLTIDTTLPVSDPLRFRKSLFDSLEKRQ